MKKSTGTPKSTVPVAPVNLDGLLDQLRTLIAQARQQALRTVDVIQVRTCWEMGRHIVEFEQGGAERAQYGTRLLPRLAERLTAEFGKGFDERNLRHMRAFFQTFPIWNALRSELSWTHYRLLMQVEDRRARDWYMAEAASQNWGIHNGQYTVTIDLQAWMCSSKSLIAIFITLVISPLHKTVKTGIKRRPVRAFQPSPDAFHVTMGPFFPATLSVQVRCRFFQAEGNQLFFRRHTRLQVPVPVGVVFA